MYKRILILLILLAGIAAAENDIFPSIHRIFKAGNAYDNQTQMVDCVGYWGATVDLVAAGVNGQHTNSRYFFDSLKDIAYSLGRTISVLPYNDLHYVEQCGDALSSDSTHDYNIEYYNDYVTSDSMGYNWKKQFMLLDEDSVSYTFPLAATARCAGSGTAARKYAPDSLFTAGDTLDARVVHDQINNNDGADQPTSIYMYDYSSSEFRLWKPYGFLRLLSQRDLAWDLDSMPDGLGLDNCGIGSHLSSSYICNTGNGHYWSTFGGPTGSGWTTNSCSNTDWVGWPDAYSTSSAALWTHFQLSLIAVCSTMTAWGYTMEANGVNTPASYLKGLFYAQNGGVAHVFFETRGNDMALCLHSFSDMSNGTTSNGDLARADTCAKYHIYHSPELRVLGTIAGDTGRSFDAHAYFGMYKAFGSQVYMEFCYEAINTSGTNYVDFKVFDNWDLWKRNFGDTIGARTLIETGTTVDGDGVHIYKREYDSAFALWFVMNNTGDDTATTNYITVDLGEPVYELGRTYPGQCDSTYRADGIVYISPGHAVIAWKLAGNPPPGISTILPTSGYVDSTDAVSAVITDDYGVNHIYNYIWPPDSVHGVNDSISIFDSAYSTGDTAVSWNPSHNYMWTDSGQTWIVFVAVDDSSNTTRDSNQILIDVQAAPAAADSVTRFLGGYYKGVK